MEFANQLFIVVPEGLIQPEGFREEWGLIWVAEDGTVTIVQQISCPLFDERNIPLILNLEWSKSYAYSPELNVKFATALPLRNTAVMW